MAFDGQYNNHPKDATTQPRRVPGGQFGGKGLCHISLFDLNIISAPVQDVIGQILHSGRRSRVAFFNAHCGNVMAKDAEYRGALQSADLVLPDGIGVEIAARMCGERLAQNLNGTDFVPILLTAAVAHGLSVFLLGGHPGVADTAAHQFCRQIPGLRIAGVRDGYQGCTDNPAVVAAINQSRADIVLVATGVPRQDIWLARHAHLLNARITIGVGALLDFISGRVRRAPVCVRDMRCEWLWRLATEPRRLAGRYLIGNATFLARAAAYALPRRDYAAIGSRGLELVLTAMVMALLAPLLVLIVVAIRLDSPGPALFRQTRIGLGGKPFTMLKFRTMATDASARRAALLAGSDRQGICFKSRNDPRITRLGRLLRRYSLDELPQLVNVLRGDMALVGPRPGLPEEVASYPVAALERLTVKPGLTGIWQLSGRAEIGFDKMVDMDVAYARSHSALLDLLLIAMTFRAIISGRGAY